MVGHTDVKIYSKNSSSSVLRPCQPTLPPKFLLAATPRVCVCVNSKWTEKGILARPVYVYMIMSVRVCELVHVQWTNIWVVLEREEGSAVAFVGFQQ